MLILTQIKANVLRWDHTLHRVSKRFQKVLVMLSLWRPVLKSVLTAAALIGALALLTVASRAADPLPSWNDGPAKQSIISFVERVTSPG